MEYDKNMWTEKHAQEIEHLFNNKWFKALFYFAMFLVFCYIVMFVCIIIDAFFVLGFMKTLQSSGIIP